MLFDRQRNAQWRRVVPGGDSPGRGLVRCSHRVGRGGVAAVGL